MRIQAHPPAVGIGAREWRATMIVLISLFAASALLLTLHSAGIVNSALFDRSGSSSIIRSKINSAHPVTLGVLPLKLQSVHWRAFSVAHAQPSRVAAMQRFSLGREALASLDAFKRSKEAHLSTVWRQRPGRRFGHGNLLFSLMLLQMNRANHN